MTKRYEVFDWIRVGALGFILICHFLRCYPCCKVDLPFGAVGNTVFFAISGWLLGLGWIAIGRPKYGLNFLQKRLKRLAVPLWIALVVVVLYQIFTGHSMQLKSVIMAATLTIWFDTSRLPGTTPYWFVTAIVIFYLFLIAWSRIWDKSTKMGVGVVFILLCGQAALSSLHIRYGWFVCLVLFGGVLFVKADRILYFCESVLVRKLAFPLSIGFLLSFAAYYAMFFHGCLAVGTPSCYWLAIIPSMLFIALIFAAFEGMSNRFVRHIGGISYEIFLVHSFVLLLTWPLRGHLVLRAFVFLVGSYVGGYILNRTTNTILSLMTRRELK